MLDEGKFLDLIKETGGFEVVLGFRDNVDHFIGGSGDKYWYFIKKGTKEEFYLCTRQGETQTDVHYIQTKKKQSSEPVPSGETMKRILSELAVGQMEIEKDGRKPTKTALYGHPCSHYSFSFGERAYKISDEFGITVEYSNINDEASGFRLRNIGTGEEIQAPK